MSELNWTERQNNMVRDVIAEEIEKARLSHKFIPEFKLEKDARTVPADEFDSASNLVDDVTAIPLVEVAAPVNLTRLQAEDANLSAALLLIRRAANDLARAHDAVVFTGQPTSDRLPSTAPSTVYAIGGSKSKGVVDSTAKLRPFVDVDNTTASYGETLIVKVADALVSLEDAGYIGSYVLVLGQDLFVDANTPSSGTLVLPKDRLEALLGGGPVHRSSVLNKNEGFLLSLGGEPMDRAVAVAPKFEFLRIGRNTRKEEVRECRVVERYAFRLKEKGSVVQFQRI